MKLIAILIVLPLIFFGCTTMSKQNAEITVTHLSKVNWQPLNPARGDKSPKAATLWGDRKKDVATGFLVQFKDGFSSPPHIHNVSYRGIVISGLIHNDDPMAAKMWMPIGSYWTQPQGEAHITAAKGKNNMAYIEIENGPYLVRPIQKAFDSGERPVNVHPSNLVWIDHHNAQIAYLWGSTQKNSMNGTLIKIPAKTKANIIDTSTSIKAVIIQGKPKLLSATAQKLEPGSYISKNTNASLLFESSDKEDTIIYVRTRGKYSIQ